MDFGKKKKNNLHIFVKINKFNNDNNMVLCDIQNAAYLLINNYFLRVIFK